MAPLIEIQDLKQHFKIKGGLFGRNIQTVKAVDGVSFTINKGETFGLVGESGSGKTTLGRTLLQAERYFLTAKRLMKTTTDSMPKECKLFSKTLMLHLILV